jgi:hypothetical protein
MPPIASPAEAKAAFFIKSLLVVMIIILHFLILFDLMEVVKVIKMPST